MFNPKNLFKKPSEHEKAGSKSGDIPVKVTSTDNSIICLGKMEIRENTDGKEATIRDRHGDEMMPILYNTKVKICGDTKDDKSFVWGGKVRGSSPEMWRIEEIEVLADTEHREAVRHTVQIRGQITSIRFDGSEMIRKCNIKDISLTGIRVDIPELLRVGAKFRLTFEYDGEIVVVPCTIRRIVAIGDKIKTYGCEFEINNGVTRDDIQKTLTNVEHNEACRL